MRRIVIGLLAAATVVLVAATAQAGNQPNRAASPQRAALLARVSVTLTDSKIVLSAKSAKRGLVIFKVTNTGKLKHDFSIHGRSTKLLTHGQSNTLRVTFLRKGAYAYKSTQPGDAAKGLTGVFTIK
jgi:uncharacterized cupredoxin-like copper-binding protein